MNLRSIILRQPTICSADDGAGGGAGGAGGGGAAGAGGAGAGDGGAAGGGAPYYEGFANQEVKTYLAGRSYKTAEELGAAYMAAERRLGVPLERHLVLPADPNDREGMRAVLSKLGLPEKADGYGFTLDDKATDADKAFLGRATAAMHEAGVPKGQAEAVFKFWQSEAAAANTAAAQAQEAALAEGRAALQKEWGQAYEQRGKEIGRLLDRYGTPELKAALEPDKLGNHPGLAIFLGKLLDRMAEPGAQGSDGFERRDGAALTPAQATAKARELEAHPAFRDAAHAQHKEVVRQRNEFLKQASAPAA